LADILPYYSAVAEFTTRQYNQSLQSLGNLYTSSANRVNGVRKVSKLLKKDVVYMLSQTADELIGLMEKNFKVESTSTKERVKMKRLLRIVNHLKSQHLMPYIHKLI